MATPIRAKTNQADISPLFELDQIVLGGEVQQLAGREQADYRRDR